MRKEIAQRVRNDEGCHCEERATKQSQQVEVSARQTSQPSASKKNYFFFESLEREATKAFMIEVYKKRYQTCLQMLEALRKDQPSLENEVLSYNGILDPMAEGIVPVLVGKEENKNRDTFTGSQKEYVVDVLVGVRTDSGDLLGIVTSENEIAQLMRDDNKNDKIITAFLDYSRIFEQTVPIHSNRKVRGKRVRWWALQGEEIPIEERPKNTVEILQREFLQKRIITVEELREEIERMKKEIPERFRMERVYASWQEFFEKNTFEHFTVLQFRLLVSSGFYVRTFVESISDKLHISMLVFGLNRTKIVYK